MGGGGVEEGGFGYWRLYWPHSMLAWGSELRFRRRKTILALDFGSESSASDWGGDWGLAEVESNEVGEWWHLFIVD